MAMSRTLQEVATHSRFVSRTTLGRSLVPVGSASPNSPLFFAHTQAIRNGLMNMGGALGSMGFGAGADQSAWDPNAVVADATGQPPPVYAPAGGMDPAETGAYTGPGSPDYHWPSKSVDTLTQVAAAGGEGGTGGGSGGGSPQSGDSAPSFWDTIGRVVGGVVRGAVPQSYQSAPPRPPPAAGFPWATVGIVGGVLVGAVVIYKVAKKR